MPKSTNVMGEFQLAEMISRCLRNRRYIFVFDDVWSSGVLDYFKYALPNNNCGSRIVVASRSAEVASAFKVPTDNSWSEAKKGLDSDSKDVYHYYLNPLPHNYAWSLFCKKAFQSESRPPELENLSWKIIDKCSGLPLVIVAIGGLLSTKERNVKAWKGMLESLDWEKDEGYQFRHVMRLEKSRAPEAEHVTETEGAKSAEIEHAIMGLEKGESPEIEHVRGTEKAKSPKVEHVMAVDRAKSFEMEHVMGADRAKTPKIEHVMGTDKDRISEIQHARGTEKVVNRKVEHVTQVEKAKSPKLEHVMRILSISYKDLPCNLKSCFLYFNMFPKNYSIKRVTLIRLWIAEGFATSEEGKTLEEVALGYLNELMQRGMVQVSEFYDYGRVRTCRIHDLFSRDHHLKIGGGKLWLLSY